METDHDPTVHWHCTWHTGPDAGATADLTAGCHLLGRSARATLRADDPALHPHHAWLEVGADGQATLLALGGTVVHVDGTAATGRAALHDGSWVEVGNSLLCLRRGPAPAGRPAALHDGAVVRAARAVPRWQPATDTTLDLPGTPDADDTDDEVDGRIGGLVPTLVGVAASGVLALVVGQVTFLLFGLLGAAVAVASWVGQRTAFARRRRRAAARRADAAQAAHQARQAARAAYRRHHEARVPTVVDAVRIAAGRDDRLWARRPEHGDAMLAALGVGDVVQPVDDQPLVGVAVPVELGPGCRLALRGPQAHGVARSLLVQLATSCGPADVRIVVVSARPGDWSAISDLPHLTLPDGTCAVTDATGLPAVLAEWSAHQGHLVLVADDPAVLAVRTSPLRRTLADPTRHALVAVLPAEATVPHWCTAALTTTAGVTAQWVPDTRDTLLPQRLRVAALGERAAQRATTALRGLVDPEDPLSSATDLPRALQLSELYGGTLPDAEAVARHWATAGVDPAPRALVGMAADGVVDIDLVRDGPHGLIVGTTGAGKSELLRTLVVGMAATASPTHLTFVLVDYKGGATFDSCAELPHVVGVITDLDEHLADRALRSLHAELRRREAVLRAHGAADLPALRATAPHVVLPRLVVVIDEFATLVAEQPTFLHALVGVAQRGRSLGVHLLLATQRPQGVISDDVRANTNLRVALRLQDSVDALDVVGVAAPAQLPRTVPGRAVLRLGADDHLTFQTARCTGGHHDTTALRTMVRSIDEAARAVGVATPPGPWRPPLPTLLGADETPVGALGLVDDPDRQRVLPLRRAPGDGHLLVAGSAGSGVTSTLCTLAAHTLATSADHVYVLDARQSAAYDAFVHHPRCGAVVRAHERERLARLLHHLRRSGSTDRTVVAGSVRTVLVIDGLDALRRTLDHPNTSDQYDALADLLATASGDELTIVAGVEHTVALPAAFVARCAERWVLHLHDPHDAAPLGVSAGSVPSALPGRLVRASDGLTAQVVCPGAAGAHATVGDQHPAPRIEVVSATVSCAELAPGWQHDGTTALAVGIDLDTGGTRLLRVHDGEHVLVLGAPRTGRTTALAHLAAQWRALHPDGWVGAVVPRRRAGGRGGATGLLDALPQVDLQAPCAVPTHVPALLVIDDAELVDDPGGHLAQLAASAGGGLVSVFAAGRPDALRQAYGHWTTVVRRSRLGLVAVGGGEMDGDLVGALLPRRTPVAPRPGLVWAVDDDGTHLVQVAEPDPTGWGAGWSAGWGDRCSDLLHH